MLRIAELANLWTAAILSSRSSTMTSPCVTPSIKFSKKRSWFMLITYHPKDLRIPDYSGKMHSRLPNWQFICLFGS